MSPASPLSKLLALVEQFVIEHKGHWGHADWENLVEDARSLGYPFDEDECKRNLGNILESGKYFFLRVPAKVSAPAKKVAAAKKVAETKKAAPRKK